MSPLLKRQVRSIATDRHGGLWFGTKGDGLIHIPEYEKNWDRKEAVELYSGSSRQALSDYLPWEMIIVYFQFMKVDFMMACGLEGLMRTYFISIHLSNPE